jgi:hypothetical protein
MLVLTARKIALKKNQYERNAKQINVQGCKGQLLAPEYHNFAYIFIHYRYCLIFSVVNQDP